MKLRGFEKSSGKLWICLILSIGLLLPLLIIGIYNRPSADDFVYALLTREAVLENRGLFGILAAAFETNLNFYNTWQGLYSSAFLLSLQPAIFGEEYYALAGVMVMGLTYLFTFLAVHLVNKMYIKKSLLFSVTVSLALYTMLVMFLPSAVQGIYWYNGAMNYIPWAFTNVFNICLLLRIQDHGNSKKGMIYLAVSTLLSFLTSGGNHVTAFGNILMLLILSGYFLTKKKFYPLLPLAAAVIGFVIMYYAPGTAIRAAHYSQQTVKNTIVAVLMHFRDNAYKWINLQWLISLVAITPVCLLSVKHIRGKIPVLLPFVSLILSAGVICGMLAVPYFAMGYFGEMRTTNVIWVTFMFLSWFNYGLFFALLSQRELINTKKILSFPYLSTASWLVGCGALVLAFVSTSVYGETNSYKAMKELAAGIPQAYASQMDARFAQYNDPSLTEVKVKPLDPVSEILFFAEMSDDPEEWPNTDMRDYYGKSISVENPQE